MCTSDTYEYTMYMPKIEKKIDSSAYSAVFYKNFDRSEYAS